MDGEILYFEEGYAVKVNDEIHSFSPNNGIYEDGCFRVGYEINPGNYIVEINKKSKTNLGYISIYTDSRLENCNLYEKIMSNTIFSIELEHGMIVKLKNCRIDINSTKNSNDLKSKEKNILTKISDEYDYESTILISDQKEEQSIDFMKAEMSLITDEFTCMNIDSKNMFLSPIKLGNHFFCGFEIFEETVQLFYVEKTRVWTCLWWWKIW
ncbi:MAG: hypothetical protein ACRCUP_05525 [Mycoplasmatales bacterium]